MDFALKELQKYGWSSGSGLGRNEDGITTAIKPKLKFDNAGIGHSIGEEFTNNWWENVYNNAAKKINKEDPPTKSTMLGNKKKEKQGALQYGSFIKTGTLTEKGFESTGHKVAQEKPQKNNKPVLTDEELLAACGGRTVHKCARHGMKMNGKLSRLEKQEKLLLKKMKHCSLSDNDAKKIVKLKKLRKEIVVTVEKYKPLDTTDDNTSTCSTSTATKKRNKPKKKVSFSEIVTQVVSEDVLDLSFESEPGSLRDENSNDEGIEHDSENKDCSDQDSDTNRAFEEPRSRFCDLSKAERKKLKKKRKLASRDAGTNATSSFLSSLTKEKDNLAEPTEDTQMEWIATKRKRHDELDKDNNCKRCHREKKRERKKKRFEAKLSNITKSFEGVCHISQDVE